MRLPVWEKGREMKNKIDSSLIKALLWTVLGMVVMIFGTYYLVYGNFRFWESLYKRTFLTVCVLGYLSAGIVALRIKRFSYREQLGIAAFVITIVLCVMLSVIAVGRIYYSRKFLVIFYLFTVFWIGLGLFMYRNPKSLFYLICPVGLGFELAKKGSHRWELLKKPEIHKECDGIIIDYHEKISPEWMRFIANVSLTNIPIYHAATVYEKATGRISLRHLSSGVVSRFKVPKLYFAIKRVLECLTVIVGLPLILPLCLFAVIIIKSNSRGPALFIQERVGRGGKPFRMYKFRTMITESEAQGAKFTCTNDSRIIPMGKFLRKFRIDELPQLVNVLKGDMSLIGPRPEQVCFVKEFEREIPFYAYRHLTSPGITGWAQVVQGYAAGVEETEEKLSYDLYYVKYMGFWLDLLIFIKTVKTILTGFGSK